MNGRLYQIWNRKKTAKFQARLLEWYGRRRRSLPWRARTDPYRVWIAEVMLQQTQVRTVLPFYGRFLKKFPDVERLARASEADVVACWAGLGYYSRARNLHRAAGRIVREFGGMFPCVLEDAVRLPGVGRYTAGAVLSIAFNQPHPVVDGNVRRVISRLDGLTEVVPESYFWSRAAAWIPEGKASPFNQAVMELGALVCVPDRPSCRECPVASLCGARRLGIQKEIPVRRAKRKSRAVELVILLLTCRDRILLSRKKTISYLPGDWALPACELREGLSSSDAARELATEISGASFKLRAGPTIRHAITFRRIGAHVFQVQASRPDLAANDGSFEWFPRSSLPGPLISSLFLKALGSDQNKPKPVK